MTKPFVQFRKNPDEMIEMLVAQFIRCSPALLPSSARFIENFLDFRVFYIHTKLTLVHSHVPHPRIHRADVCVVWLVNGI